MSHEFPVIHLSIPGAILRHEPACQYTRPRQQSASGGGDRPVAGQGGVLPWGDDRLVRRSELCAFIRKYQLLSMVHQWNTEDGRARGHELQPYRGHATGFGTATAYDPAGGVPQQRTVGLKDDHPHRKAKAGPALLPDRPPGFGSRHGERGGHADRLGRLLPLWHGHARAQFEHGQPERPV